MCKLLLQKEKSFPEMRTPLGRRDHLAFIKIQFFFFRIVETSETEETQPVKLLYLFVVRISRFFCSLFIMWHNLLGCKEYVSTVTSRKINFYSVIETSLFGLGPLAMPAQAAGECKGHRRKRQCGMMVQSKPGVASIMAY